jgi:hypothetical protein
MYIHVKCVCTYICMYVYVPSLDVYILLLGPLSVMVHSLTLSSARSLTRSNSSQPKFILKLEKWPKINVFTETAF